MPNASRPSGPARLPFSLKWALLGWIIAETLVFLVLVHVIGFGGTVLLGLTTTVVGLVAMRRIGTGALTGLRRSMEGGVVPDGSLLDGMLGALGALLLVLPGFLANAVGLALLSPSIRAQAMLRFGGGSLPARRRQSMPSEVIDLGPDEWRPVDRR